MMNKKLNKKIAVFVKEKYGHKEAITYLREHFKKVDIFKGQNGDTFPRKSYENEYDICVSYMSPWIMPEEFLSKIKEFAINFHPGPPDYRGIGCTNFAIYKNEKQYGVTAHLMIHSVDAGRIINVRRFPVSVNDTLLSLTNKCYRHILKQFYKVFDYYLSKNLLPQTRERWDNKLYTRKELNDLCKVDFNMTKKEIERRIKSTNFPNMPKAWVNIYGYKFEFKDSRYE